MRTEMDKPMGIGEILQICLKKICLKYYRITNPAALISDPLGDLLSDDKFDDEANDVGEEAVNAALQDGHGETVTKGQEGHNASPVDAAIFKEPAKTIQVTLKTCDLQ